MVKFGKVVLYGSCVTLILIVLSILSPAALAKGGDGTDKDSGMKSLETVQSRIKEKVQERNQTENGTLEKEQLREKTQEKTQLKEQLKIQKDNYQTSKQNFLKIRSRLRSGNYNEEDLNTTKAYLNSSIDYMIANLEKVRYNLEQSNGNGTEVRIAAIDGRISQLEEEKKAIGNATGFEDLTNAANSVRSTWNNAKNSTVADTGKTVSEKIENFLDRSENITLRLESEIKAANETGVNTAELEAKMAEYNELMDSAREKNKAAGEILNKEDATQEELEDANEYLQNALEDTRAANEILKEVFNKLEPYREQYRLEEQNKEMTRLDAENINTSADNETEDEDGNEDVQESVTTNSSSEETDS
jgi:gas vesicle protein